MSKLFGLTKSLMLIVSLCTTTVQAEGDKPLEIGLLPYLSPDMLMQRYAPFVNYVGEQMGRPIHVTTAPSFPVYVDRAAQKRYDLYVTAPHFAVLAEEKYGYKRLARLTRELDGAMVVRVDSKYQKIEDLKGKVLATPDHLAIITILGELSLEEHGIDPKKDIIIRSAPSHNTALLEVIKRRADAAVVSTAVYESMKPEHKSQLRLLFSTAKVPHMMFLANPDMADTDYEKMKKAILNFTAKGAGKAFFEESGYIDMQAISDEDMAYMKTMLPLLTPRMEK